MKVNKNRIVVGLSVVLSSFVFTVVLSTSVSAQSKDTIGALQRGYRTGYSDGYMAGYKDTIDRVPKDFAHHADYIKADRAFNKDYGELQDYRDGYQQGFESGYDTGFERRSFEATLPAGLQKRVNAVLGSELAETRPAETTPPPPPPAIETGSTTQSTQPPSTTKEETVAIAASGAPVTDQPPPPAASDGAPIREETAVSADAPVKDQTTAGSTDAPVKDPAPAVINDAPVQKEAYQAPAGDPIVIIPRDTELILELQDDLNTQQTKEGQRFTAKVASPSEIAGATIEGRVSRVRQPGRLRQRSELTLSFDRVVLSDNRWSNFSGTMVEVIPVKGDNISRVDTEGTAIGQSTFKHDAITLGSTTGGGTIIGAVTGGPVGAAIGAGVGAAFGVGAVVVDRGKHVRLNKNQQIRVRSSYETQIR